MARNKSSSVNVPSQKLKIKSKNLTRKELRKQIKTDKKQRKHQYFSKQKNDKESYEEAKLAKKNVVENNRREEIKKSSKVLAEKSKKKTMINCNAGGTEELALRNRKRQRDLETEARKQRIKQLKLDNMEEDKMIARLEKKLKLNKTKNKNRLVRKMFSDGLDFALELCLNDEDENMLENRKGKNNKAEVEKFDHKEKSPSWSDEEQDEERFNEVFGSSGDSASEDIDDDDDSDENEEQVTISKKKEKPSKSTSDSSNSIDEEASKETVNKSKYREDIYGREVDEHGNIIKPNNGGNVYVPPHRRNLKSDDKESELIERLTKQCKGWLNRLSEANLHKIANGIEQLYMKNSRYNMNETLMNLLRDALITRHLNNERMVQEHVVLLAYLHAHIGTEIGAHFLQMFVEEFEKLLKEQNEELKIEDKRLNNIVLILCYMYIFGIFDNHLTMEIIGRLSENLNEKTIECLLLIFQSVGFRLRKDDPIDFKRMIHDVQNKLASSSEELKDNTRAKYMIDILNAVKNNNVNKIPKYDPSLYDNLRKKLKAMLRNDKYVISLNITLQDLLKVDSVGKWWVVGSAWSGNIQEMASAQKSASRDDKLQLNDEGKGYSEKILELAKRQQMNTQERRQIFCIIMSATDYVDAFEKVLHLNLKDQRSIAYVIIHCCLNEKRFNPYYAHLAMKFCNSNRKYQLAFQFASWDRINDIESLNKLQVKNFAHFLKYLIILGGLQLSILKVINFLELDKQNFALMRDICIGILLWKDEEAIFQAFQRLAKNIKLQQFKQSLRLFLQHFLLKDSAGTIEKLSSDDKAKLKERIDRVDNLLAYVDL